MVDGPSVYLRRGLVIHLRRLGVLHDQRVAEAFLAVPREAFVIETLAHEGLAAVYRDDAIVTRRDPTSHVPLSSSSQPAIMALMLEMLEVHPGHRVLEIGTGTGYNAAMLDRLVGNTGLVVSMDIDAEIVRSAAVALDSIDSRAQVLVGDGIVGLPGAATEATPFDRIEVTASTAAIPRAWYDQLRPNGRLVVPLRLSHDLDRVHAVTSFRRVPGGFESVAVTPGGFMPLRRSNGSTFAPVADPVGASGRGPLGREDVERLRITVRYGRTPPPARWRLDRGDHWVGVDVGES